MNNNGQSIAPSGVLFSCNDQQSIQGTSFPIDIFPPVVADFIKASEESLNLVPDFMGIGLLSAAATLIGNSYQLQIKPDWVERPLCWFALVGHSGIRKTPSLNAALKPLMTLDHKLYQTY